MTGLIRLALSGDRETADRAEYALEAGNPAPISTALFAGGGTWTLEALYGQPPERHAIAELLSAALGRAPEFDLAPLPERDWIAESLKGLAPVRAGRFLIHGSHDRKAARHSPLAIEIEAGAAFGTGHHATTFCCLEALGHIARAHHHPRILDIGTGTGILAIAAAKLWKAPVMASDIDPVAVAVARINARINAVTPLINAINANSALDPRIVRHAPYDLIIVNIHAKPLMGLAAPVAQIASHRSKIILSGLLENQTRMVAAAWRTHGFVRCRQFLINGWATLLLARPGIFPVRNRRMPSPYQANPSRWQPLIYACARRCCADKINMINTATKSAHAPPNGVQRQAAGHLAD